MDALRPIVTTAISFTLLFITTVIPAFAAGPPLKKVSLIPVWKHQAQFAGYYVALNKGIYARHGIDLAILPGGPGHQPAQDLQNGAADLAVLWLSEAIRLRASGLQLVNVSQIVQKSSMVFISRKTSGIKKISDLQDRRIGVWDNEPNLPAREFFKKYNLKMKVVPNLQTVNLFLRGGLDVTAAMWYNEYHTILNSGVNSDELNLFFLSDYGIRFPEDGLYMLEKNYRKDPRLAEAFAKASIEGWLYAFDHPDEAIDIVISYMKKDGTPANRAHQKWMLSSMRNLVIPPEKDRITGQLNQSDYEYVAASLLASGAIKKIPSFPDFIGKSNAQK